LTVYLRLFLLGFASLVIVLTDAHEHPRRRGFRRLPRPAARRPLGMLLMASANHLLMAYIAVEMASCQVTRCRLPQGQAMSSEAALKYVVYGGGVGRHAIWHQFGCRQVRHRLFARRGSGVSVTLSHGKVDVPLAMGLTSSSSACASIGRPCRSLLVSRRLEARPPRSVRFYPCSKARQ